MNQHPKPTKSRLTSAATRFRLILHLGLILMLTVASGCGKEEVIEDNALQQPETDLGPVNEVPKEATANPPRDDGPNRNAPSQSTADEVVDIPDPIGD